MMNLSTAVHAADLALSEHPFFGDSPRILAKVLARYRFGLELFAERLPSLARAVATVEKLGDADARRIFFDPLVRLTLERAFSELEAGRLMAPHPLEELLPGALEVLPLGLCESRMPSRLRVGSKVPKWLWDVARPSDPYAQALHSAFDGIFGENPKSRGTLLSPEASAQRKIDDSIELLSMLLPHSGAAALTHIEAIALLSARLEGGTVLSAAGGDLTPSTIFLSLDDLGNPWDIAGSLLHEGLHMKLFDATRSVSIAAAPAETIQVPWRDIRWSIVRTVFAYHVYVHLSLFKAAALSVDRAVTERFGDPSAYATRPHAMSVVNDGGGARFGRSIDRARYLGEQLQTTWSHLLTPQGRDFVRWLGESLAPVDREVFGDEAVGSAGDPERAAYQKVPGLRARPSTQGECLMVFSPGAPKLHWLDLNAWLIFELSDGRTFPEMERAYLEVIGGRVEPDEARRQLRSGLDSLVRSTLVVPTRQKGEAV
ncbi:aKG-HExxH-type peptide beta-hydroxylase [Archangium lansingense]|uniref:aKG-HExxH-type peptide beta-hydroxylase n=1 Tax=Archangium lansingense TaxID=2995310 RepID=UPI003B7BF455